MSGYLMGRFRKGESAGSPLSTLDAYPDCSQIRFRASAIPAPTTPPLPVASPGTPTSLGALTFAPVETLLLWDLVPESAGPGKIHPSVFTDYAWRWRKHNAALFPADPGTPVIGADGTPSYSASAYAGVDSDGVWIHQGPIASGGGSFIGDDKPGLSFGGAGAPLVDPSSSPVWTLLVEWDSDGAVTTSGTAPVLTSSSSSAPAPPRVTSQPIVGNTYTNSPWVLYLGWSGSWVGSPGSWSCVMTATLYLLVGGSGGPTAVMGKRGVSGETTVISFDNTNHQIVLVGGDPSLSSVSVPSGYSNPYSVVTTPEGWPAVQSTNTSYPSGWPSSQVFGDSNMGAYYWASYRQFNGHLKGVAITSMTASETTELLSERSAVPGTGPVSATGMKFRASLPVSGTISSRLSGYTHYFPLDDPSPGPMYDLLGGSRLSVVNPSQATFQVDGVENPLAPDHTKGLRLGRSVDSVYSGTRAYLQWTAGARPGIGTGAAGDDLTIGMWVRWEGPPLGSTSQSVFQGETVPFGFTQEPSLGAYIAGSAEPFGVTFSVWDSTASHFETLSTQAFDWPAEYLLDWGAGPGVAPPATPYDTPVAYKGPTWAYLAVVLRTVSGHMTMETWMDGVIVAQQAGSDTGWGAVKGLLYVGFTLAPATIQHLSIWPFALSAGELSGLSAS